MSLLAKSHPDTSSQDPPSYYADYVAGDFIMIVDLVMPEGRQGLPTLMNTKQILGGWRSKGVIGPQKVDDVLATLEQRHAATKDEQQSATSSSARPQSALPRHEVFKRIEEDRERHKRLRERRWVQAVSHAPTVTPTLASFLRLTDEDELTLDIEFENDWDAASDWNEDDDDACAEEIEMCYPSAPGQQGGPKDEQPMDLS